MDWLEAALAGTSATEMVETMERFRASIDPAWVEQALEATGTATVRKRRIPAEEVVWLIIGMAMQRDEPIDEVAANLDLVLPDGTRGGAIAKSSVAEARQRLGEYPMRWLFEFTAQKWARESAEKNAWRGLSVFAADGTSLRIADSEENREHFEKPGTGQGESGYPVVRVNTLMALRSHLLLDANFGPYRTAELALAEDLWPTLPDHSITVLDKLYGSPGTLFAISRGGEERHWLVRRKKNATGKVIETFTKNDQLVEITTTTTARKKDPTLPKKFTARAIRSKVPGAREPRWLLTSLLDPKEYPAKELVALYHERWEIEIGYGEIKVALLNRRESLRSRKVEGVHQEVWGILLAYNMIRFEMESLADEAGVEPSRLSFLTALRTIRWQWHVLIIAKPGALPKRVKAMREHARFILPQRRQRTYPRGVKVFGSRYPPISRARRGLGK